MSDREDPQQVGPKGSSAYRRLLDEVRDGRLLPGDRLREPDLAARAATNVELDDLDSLNDRRSAPDPNRRG